MNKAFEEPIKIFKNQPLGVVVIEPEPLKFKYEASNYKKTKTVQKKKIEEAAQLDNNTGNLEALLTSTTFPMQAKLHLVSSKLL